MIIAPPFFFVLLNRTRQLAIAHRELVSVAATDSPTSLLNRRALTGMADGYLRHVENAPVFEQGALLIIDVDHFKAVNDRFGPDCGDEALILIAKAISVAVRDIDLVGRVGGEEFSGFIPGLTAEHIPVIAERIRKAVSEAVFFARGERHDLSVSVGVCFDHSFPFADLYRSADERLYSAKHNGRNRAELSAFDPEAAAQVVLH